MIVIIILGVYYFRKTNKKSTFWKFQPVSRNNIPGIHNKGFLITTQAPRLLPLKKGLELKILDLDSNIKNLENISFFLNNNYVFGYKYTPKFLKWSINIPNSIENDTWNITLWEKGNLIGTIISKPISIYMELFGNYNSVYVDYLSVKKEFRSQNLAPILISHTVSNCWKQGFNLFIFKKEGNPLPFNVICQTHFYLLSVKEVANTCLLGKNNSETIHIVEVNNDNITEVYHFYNTYIQKFSIYPKYNLLQFTHMYRSSDIVKSYVLQVNGEIAGFATFVVNHFQMYTLKYKIAEIMYYFAPEKYFNLLFYTILQESKLLGIDKITIIDIMDNYKLLQEFNFQKSMKLNFQMYNYHHPKSIDKKKFAYNIL